MQYWVVLCCMRTELLFIQFYRETRKLQLVLFFGSEPTLLRVRGEPFSVFFFPSFTPAPDTHGRTLVLVKLINRCIFYVAVASALMLCDRPRRWEVCVLSLVSTPSRSGAKTRRAVRSTPGSSRVQTVIELDFDESEALWVFFFLLSFVYFFIFLKNPSAIGTIHAHSPIPEPPQALRRRGGGVFCLSAESQRVCNNGLAIAPLGPRESVGESRGGGGEGVWRLDTRSDSLTSLSLLIIVWWPTVVLKDVSLSIKKRQIQDFFFFYSFLVVFIVSICSPWTLPLRFKYRLDLSITLLTV